MRLVAGDRIGPYEIVGSLGAGGMGEVYRAHDTRLDRDVAIKIVSGLAGGDADVRQRFEREARAISRLSHPHICVLYDIGREVPSTSGTSIAPAIDFLVMELIEGDTLAGRLARGPLPVGEALQMAVQIADALAAAHKRGIVHRDLKPGNVMLTKSGAKLLDFGLAKTVAPVMASGASMLQTTPAGLTAQGTILGTFQYMAPEQLEGGEADARTDVFALGCMLYEMLTARHPFEARSHAARISAIMTTEPPRVTALQPQAPAMIDYAVSRCLAKDPDDRWQSARDLGAELRRIAGMTQVTSTAESATAAPAVRRRRRLPVATGVAALMALVAAGLGWAWVDRQPFSPRRLHLAIPLNPSEGLEGRFALSPDGQRLAFVGHSEGRAKLYLRPLDSPQAVALVDDVPLANTAAPTFSPDGRWIAFTGSGRLWKVSTSGGAAVPLAETGASSRPAWGADDIIVFENRARGLSRVRAAGGEAVMVTTLPEGERQHTSPWLTADGRTLLFVIRRDNTDMDRGQLIAAQALDGGERTVLTDGMGPIYLESGQLVFERQGIVYAAGFDPGRLRLTSEPAPIVDGIVTSLAGSLFAVTSMFSAAQNGSIAFISGRDRGVGTAQLTLVDDRGNATPLALPPRRYADPRLSPDGRRVAVHIVEEGRENFIIDLERGTLLRLTADPGEDETPIWTPDGHWVVYTSTRNEHVRAIFRRRADGSTGEELLWSGTGHIHLGGFTPDGGTLVLAVMEESNFNLATLSMDDRQIRPLVIDQFHKTEPALSPDGQWLAYVSDETGRPEVYVQAFPNAGARYPVSANRGREPVWSRDGRQLFYRAAGRMMRVTVPVGESFSASIPVPLFEDRFLSTMGDTHTNYDVTPDGTRFLMVERVGGGVSAPTHVDIVLDLLRAR
jgi:eukaryotic-like serine/threonine-protein kinase